jgi:hypothetical protein
MPALVALPPYGERMEPRIDTGWWWYLLAALDGDCCAGALVYVAVHGARDSDRRPHGSNFSGRGFDAVHTLGVRCR